MNLPRKIYSIRHNETNRVYVGSSANLKHRIANHLQRLRTHTHHIEDMQSDFDKYGENYTIKVLDEIIEYEDRIKEYEWMEKLNSRVRGIGYNYLDTQGDTEKRSIHFITFNGETLSLGDWAKKVNLPRQILYSRIIVMGWDIEKAFTQRIRDNIRQRNFK